MTMMVSQTRSRSTPSVQTSPAPDQARPAQRQAARAVQGLRPSAVPVRPARHACGCASGSPCRCGGKHSQTQDGARPSAAAEATRTIVTGGPSEQETWTSTTTTRTADAGADATVPDAGGPDATVPDGGRPDATVPDAGAPGPDPSGTRRAG